MKLPPRPAKNIDFNVNLVSSLSPTCFHEWYLYPTYTLKAYLWKIIRSMQWNNRPPWTSLYIIIAYTYKNKNKYF